MSICHAILNFEPWSLLSRKPIIYDFERTDTIVVVILRTTVLSVTIEYNI